MQKNLKTGSTDLLLNYKIVGNTIRYCVRLFKPHTQIHTSRL